ncbi:hypothetical protein BCR43DRAFT_490445 [Syncephalastrum racemosum]|uniref:Uncharacterized protein n=1 Tax=Syncephalastrum racemosum TaxID=13706 RepID=A0A1X2HFV2_SYNRA|nr:hypothetical protein BCR43DRAFT_490445 [Syncephalastrum racemosum]
MVQQSHQSRSEWQYLKVKMYAHCFGGNTSVGLWIVYSWGDGDAKLSTTELSFRMSIQQALQNMFGLASAAAIVDVLDWSEDDNTGIVKVRQSDLLSVWNALILYQPSTEGQRCAFDILATSASLISLAADSRCSV